MKHKNWEFVITCILGTCETFAEYPHFGLASDNEEGRCSAIAFLKKTNERVKMLNESCGRNAVIAVQIHSAPKRGVDGVSSSKESLFKSLKEISSWDWRGSQLSVEHCDQYIQGQVASKGFISLQDEIWALQTLSDSNTQFGITINWGRSAIEGRSVSIPPLHIQIANESGLGIKGLMFSGATSENDPIYGQWLDNHVPFACSFNSKASLMDANAIDECFSKVDWKKLLYMGIKIWPKPATLTIDERVQFINEGTQLLEERFQRLNN